MFQRWASSSAQPLSDRPAQSLAHCARRSALPRACAIAERAFPARRASAGPVPHCMPRLVSSTEMARVLATAEQLPASHANPLRAQPSGLALLLLFCCGLRRGELLRLQLRHYDAGEGVLVSKLRSFPRLRVGALVPIHRARVEALLGAAPFKMICQCSPKAR